MPFLPPIPPWSSLHVLVVHMPIGLLLLSPILLILGMLPGRWRDGLRVGALLVLVLGSAAAYLALQSGEAAAMIVDRSEQIDAVLARHAQFAELTCGIFLGGTIIYGLFLGVGLFFPAIGRGKVALTAQIVALLVITSGCLLLADTGHLGGQLVHELGIRAML